MRIVVFSDSHGSASQLEKIICEQENVNHFFFLGDVLADIEDLRYLYPDKSFYSVAGNCDYFSTTNYEAVTTLCNVKILFCHGHTLNVKHGLTLLEARAINEGASLVLYGHTHCPAIDFKNNICFVNPGSVSRSRNGRNSYAVIDITDGKITPAIVEI